MNQDNIDPVKGSVNLKKTRIKKAVDKKFLTGCIEGVYAALYGLSLIYLAGAFVIWQCTISAVSFKNANYKTVAYFISVLLIISFMQFARIYHYVHEFDKHHGDESHFIYYLKGVYRFADRFLRAAAAFFVILCVKDQATKSLATLSAGFDSQNPNYASLEPMVNILFYVFVTLIFWDVFIVIWKKKSNTYKKMTSPNNTPAEISLAQYDHPLKILQRLTGALCAAFFFQIIKNPDSTIFFILEGIFLGLFLLFWFADYLPDGWSKWNPIKMNNPRPGKIKMLFSEMFSWYSTIKSLLFGV